MFGFCLLRGFLDILHLLTENIFSTLQDKGKGLYISWGHRSVWKLQSFEMKSLYWFEEVNAKYSDNISSEAWLLNCCITCCITWSVLACNKRVNMQQHCSKNTCLTVIKVLLLSFFKTISSLHCLLWQIDLSLCSWILADNTVPTDLSAKQNKHQA